MNNSTNFPTSPAFPHGFANLSDTTRIAHRMYAVGSSYYLHITKEVAQATINTGVVGETIPAVTLCNKTFTHGAAWEIADTGNTTAKVCKACATKAAK
jgi:hypothetical protein